MTTDYPMWITLTKPQRDILLVRLKNENAVANCIYYSVLADGYESMSREDWKSIVSSIVSQLKKRDRILLCSSADMEVLIDGVESSHAVPDMKVANRLVNKLQAASGRQLSLPYGFHTARLFARR